MNITARAITFTLISLFTLSAIAGPLGDRLDRQRERGERSAPSEVRKILRAGVKDLKATKLAEKSLKKGVKIPNFVMVTASGKKVSLKSLYKKSQVLVKFYRGAWCAYCQLELKAYQEMMKKFKAKNVQIIGLTPDHNKSIRMTKKRLGITFPIYSDTNNAIAKKIGIVFRVDKATLSAYKDFGIDLDSSQGNSNKELPMPGTYLIDQKGIIRFVFVDPDYIKRVEPSRLLKAA